MRKTAIVKIAEEGRDKGKIFVITEPPASQVERWALRALMALAKSGVELPENVKGAGIAGVAALGLKAIVGGVGVDDTEWLMSQMMACVQLQPGPDPNVVRPLIEDDIDEVATRFKLYFEVFNLITGFSQAGSQSTLKTPEASPASPNTRTFQGQSGPSSLRARRR
jgi:hypothetical protein